MRIVFLNDVEARGGAAICASRLAASLAQSGHEITRIVAYPGSGAHPWKTKPLNLPETLILRARRKLYPAAFYEKSCSVLLQKNLDEILAGLNPDWINIHNLHSAIPKGWRDDLVKVCLNRAPTVWTLHDMWSFTGRCAYAYDCRRFLSGCDENCPTPNEYPALAPHRIRNVWLKREHLMRELSNLIAVTPSQWLAGEAKQGFWKDHRIEIIPYGIPLQTFCPMEKDNARKALGLPTDQPVLLLVSVDLTERRKGSAFLMKALDLLPFKVTVITLGANPPEIHGKHILHRPLGYVEDDSTKCMAYNAASLLVHPSIADNLPNVILESIACGTPVVAFNTGGVEDAVRPGVTGWLADAISAESLAKAIEMGLDHSKELAGSCRRVAEEEYSDDLQARRYLQLMESR